jgi:hypothetical protein
MILRAEQRSDRLQRWVWVLLDGAIWSSAIYAATQLGFNFRNTLALVVATTALLAATCLAYIIGRALMSRNAVGHRRSAFESTMDLGGTVLITTIGLLVWAFLASPLVVPRSVPVVSAALALVGMSMARLLNRSWRGRHTATEEDEGHVEDRVGDQVGDPPMLGRKSVLVMLLGSGFVIANAAHWSAPTAGNAKPGNVPATQPAQPAKPTPPRGTATMLAKDNGVVGDGITDDGAALNALLLTAATRGAPVVLTALSTIYTTVGIVLPSNTRLNGKGSTIKCGFPASYTPTVGILNASNVLVEDLNINGNKAAFGDVLTEFKHGIGMRTSTDVLLRNVQTNSNKGDGIQIAGDNATSYSQRVTLEDVVCQFNHRNGLSVISCKTLRVVNGSYSYSSGTKPECGIDIEPNHASDTIENLAFYGLVAEGNGASGLSVALSTTPPVTQGGIEFTNCSFTNNQASGVNLITANQIKFTNCAIKNNRYAGISKTTEVKNLSVVGGAM